MIPNPNIYNDDTLMIMLIVFCLVVLATVMIPKAVRHRKQLTLHERKKPAPDPEQDFKMHVVPTGKTALSYGEKFLSHNMIKKRECVYISHEIHIKIMRLVHALDGQKITIGGYIDTVLRDHLEEYKDEINTIYFKSRENLL